MPEPMKVVLVPADVDLAVVIQADAAKPWLHYKSFSDFYAPRVK